MWKALRILKKYSTPQQLRIFSTNSNSHNNEFGDCDVFGTLVDFEEKKVESYIKTAIDKYPVDSFNKFVQPQKNNTETKTEFSTSSNFQQLHSVDENEKTSSCDIPDIVNYANKKFLLSKVKKQFKEEHDPDGFEIDKNDKRFRTVSQEQFSPYVFHSKMERLMKEKKYKEAIAVFEVEMPERKVHPDTQVYGLAIGIYAWWGYTKKAFQVYERMKDENAFISKRIVTSLFNACALSPWPETDGLPRAIKLKNELKSKHYGFNNSQYCAMIKAFGRTGDIETAFEIIDDIVYSGHEVGIDNINFLLQACISNKEVGFRHCLVLWKEMAKMGIKPDIYSYNLFLRCIRDCQAGDGNLFDELSNSKETLGAADPKTEDVNIKEKSIVTVANDNLPANCGMQSTNELVEEAPLSSKIVGITSLQLSEERFALIGGIQTLLENMKLYNITPTISTFGLLMSMIPPTVEAEEELFKYMELYKVKPDIATIDQLIRKRCKRRHFTLAKEALEYIPKYDLVPQVKTYMALAIACRNFSSMRELLSDMKDANIKLNHNIVVTLLKIAVRKSLFVIVLQIMRETEEENLNPTVKMIELLEEGRTTIRNELLLSERQTGEKGFISDDKRKFLMEYKPWLKRTKIHKREHPWQQFGYYGKPILEKIRPIGTVKQK